MKGHLALALWVKKFTEPTAEVRYVMEATGVYHERLAYFLEEKSQGGTCVFNDCDFCGKKTIRLHFRKSKNQLFEAQKSSTSFFAALIEKHHYYERKREIQAKAIKKVGDSHKELPLYTG